MHGLDAVLALERGWVRAVLTMGLDDVRLAFGSTRQCSVSDCSLHAPPSTYECHCMAQTLVYVSPSSHSDPTRRMCVVLASSDVTTPPPTRHQTWSLVSKGAAHAPATLCNQRVFDRMRIVWRGRLGSSVVLSCVI